VKADAATAITLDRVTKIYDAPVVSDVSLDITGGSFVTLLGPSGSGKSTILQMIGGFVPPTSGHILFGGEDVTELPPNKRPCNTIFQDLGLFPHMTVAENLAYGLRLRRVPAEVRRKRVADMLALVALDGLDRRRVHQLSGGQRQRVALARALVLEPPVLLLDEPLTGLDEQLRQQLRNEIGRLHRRLGSTFLAVTHNQEEALSLSDRIAVLRAGRIEQVGSPHELYESPANAFVARFVGIDTMLRPDRVVPGDSTWTAVIAGRTIHCVPPRQRIDRGNYLVALRPERIRIATSAEEVDLGPVMVNGATYKGRDLEVEAMLPDQQLLKFLLPVDRYAAPPAVGAAINVSWRPQRALLVPETDTANRDPAIPSQTKVAS
jgi:ABC-type Fe3+/spermidine/putrescine transport system ATPase subunit